ncbi:MAG: hypothetical protein HN337_06205 [Deltaproteobacteria bacterium]|jgi:hypothetical protein|nr:hypothetical protein [Deltaproteobacteria bacterium]
MFKHFTVLLSMLALMAISSDAFCGGVDMGVIGKMVAVERIDESRCDELEDNGACAYSAIYRGLKKLREYMEHFRCINASRHTSVDLSSDYGPFTEHDVGPVVMIEMADLRCAINPRAELILIDQDEIPEQCSMLNWKCNIIWVPAYDQSTAFIGRLPK